MIKLIDILNIIDESQALKIYIGNGEYLTMNAYTALKIINDDNLLHRIVSHILFCGDSMFIDLKREEE